jgi:hypothetical protein
MGLTSIDSLINVILMVNPDFVLSAPVLTSNI